MGGLASQQDGVTSLGSGRFSTHNQPMPHVKRILCLANSRKLSGRCLAGREFDGLEAGPWIRPVSDREHEEVSEHERQYEDGSDPRVLDVIDVPLCEPRPSGYQVENWLLDPEYYWQKAGRLPQTELSRFTEPHRTLGSTDTAPGPAGTTRSRWTSYLRSRVLFV